LLSTLMSKMLVGLEIFDLNCPTPLIVICLKQQSSKVWTKNLLMMYRIMIQSRLWLLNISSPTRRQKIKGDFDFKNVSFHYHESDKFWSWRFRLWPRSRAPIRSRRRCTARSWCRWWSDDEPESSVRKKSFWTNKVRDSAKLT